MTILNFLRFGLFIFAFPFSVCIGQASETELFQQQISKLVSDSNEINDAFKQQILKGINADSRLQSLQLNLDNYDKQMQMLLLQSLNKLDNTEEYTAVLNQFTKLSNDSVAIAGKLLSIAGKTAEGAVYL